MVARWAMAVLVVEVGPMEAALAVALVGMAEVWLGAVRVRVSAEVVLMVVVVVGFLSPDVPHPTSIQACASRCVSEHLSHYSFVPGMPIEQSTHTLSHSSSWHRLKPTSPVVREAVALVARETVVAAMRVVAGRRVVVAPVGRESKAGLASLVREWMVGTVMADVSVGQAQQAAVMELAMEKGAWK